MTLAATEQNIEWLIGRLYDVRRHIQCERNKSEHLIFVLLTRGLDDRARVETLFYNYFAAKYGNAGWFKMALPCESSANHTRFEFQEIGCSVMLMDV